jgi:hypothetical protein
MTAPIGPFWAGSERFVIDSDDELLLADLDGRLRDLRRPPDDRSDEDGDESTPVVFRLTRTGPGWMSHPWALDRDGEPCETTVTDSYIIPYVLWEVTRLLLEGTAFPIVPMHAAALSRNGHAVALTGPSHSGKSTLAGWLTRSGWGFLTDEVSLLDTTNPDNPIVHPFWRPIGIRRPGPLEAHIEVPASDAELTEILVPASELGGLGEAAPLVALVCPSYEPGSEGTLEPLSPAAALTMIADQLPSLGRDGGRVFHALAAIVAEIPAFTMHVDDLDTASHHLGELLDGISAGSTSRIAGTPSEVAT